MRFLSVFKRFKRSEAVERLERLERPERAARVFLVKRSEMQYELWDAIKSLQE
jgi:hypothetical protein